MSLDINLICKCCGTVLYESNITHNLATMADKADIHKPMWRPESMNITTAGELIPYLEKGLEKLQENPDYYKQFQPTNDWGTYWLLLGKVREYLAKAKHHPDALISIAR